MSQPTPSQQLAIATPGNVLVMAGAGTGKTRTLVERALAWIADPVAPGSVDRLLMVTFTEAAAAEMRRRIRERLEAAASADPGRPHLQEQLALLDTARIQTLHSFCLELVRQHFLELELDPQFRLLDEAQADLLAHETFDRLLEEHLAGNTPAAALVQQFIRERARGWDRPVRDLVFRLHAFMRSLRDPDAWFARERSRLASEEPVHWLEAAAEGFQGWKTFWLPILQVQPAQGQVPNRAAAALQALPDTFDRTAIAETIATLLADDANGWPRGTKTRLRPPLKRFFDEAAFWNSVLSVRGGVDPLQQDWTWSRGHMATLIGLAQEFGAAFEAARRQQGAVDFADLEQYALRLLYARGASAAHQPSPIALDWRERLDRLFVDEYQDINEAQDAILRAIGREGTEANRFLVGDVKQSIYRFRLANPRIFQDYAAAWRATGPTPAGCVIPLSDNFRSHEGILAFVNALFSGLMRSEVGGVDYDTDARLQFGAPSARPHLALVSDPPEQRRVELHLRLNSEEAAEGGDAEEGSIPGADPVAERGDTEHEARLVGLRLLELKADPNALWDEDLQARRPAEWNDMLVLLRAPRARAEIYAREFARLGIPIAAPRGGFLNAIEISDVVSLLRLLDNPLQDIPLLAVLRSPIVGLSLESLADIRLGAPRARFWTALLRWLDLAGPGPHADAVVRGRHFVERYGRWRTLARQGSLSECLESILDQTRYGDWCLAQERGEERHANLQRLLAMTRAFDPWQRQGLFRFLRHLDARSDAGLDLEPAAIDPGSAVRLMSVHQSKGLEAPIVVVADLGRRFNQLDSAADVILDDALGLCPRIKPPHVAQRYPGLTHWLAAQRLRRESLGEELRLFYVALTRAEQRLVLVGTAPATALTHRWPALADAPRDTQRVLGAGSWLDWLGPCLPTLLGTPGWADQIGGCGHLAAWTRYAADDARLRLPELAGSPGIPSPVPSPADAETLACLDAVALRLRWCYPFAAATREPAKASLTSLRRRAELEEESAAPSFPDPQRPEAPGPGAQERRAATRAWRRHLEGSRGTGRRAIEIGVAHHTFLEHVRLDLTSSLGELRVEVERLVQEGLLTDDAGAALDLEALHAFWTSEPGLLVRSQIACVHREMPFTLRLKGEDLQALQLDHSSRDLDDEFVVVQGIVDLAVVRPHEIWLLDFKTDALTTAELAGRTEYHAPQVRLYALALERIFGRPVTRRWLHFLTVRQTIEVNA
jgi:ATP-dependent helicase/nuclease subunit A